jgi:hypothetical protein
MIYKAAILMILFAILLTGCGGGSGSPSSGSSSPGDGSPPNGGGTTPPTPTPTPTPTPSIATLSLSPNTGSYRTGDSFKVDVFVGTGGENVVAVAANIKYDPTYFQANNIDPNGSVFPIEAEKTIDSTNGIIKITRGIITPGINTINGKVASFNLTALSPVSPTSDNVILIVASSPPIKSNIIKDDGLGTPILSVVTSARFTVQ